MSNSVVQAQPDEKLIQRYLDHAISKKNHDVVLSMYKQGLIQNKSLLKRYSKVIASELHRSKDYILLCKLFNYDSVQKINQLNRYDQIRKVCASWDWYTIELNGNKKTSLTIEALDKNSEFKYTLSTLSEHLQDLKKEDSWKVSRSRSPKFYLPVEIFNDRVQLYLSNRTRYNIRTSSNPQDKTPLEYDTLIGQPKVKLLKFSSNPQAKTQNNVTSFLKNNKWAFIITAVSGAAIMSAALMYTPDPVINSTSSSD